MTTNSAFRVVAGPTPGPWSMTEDAGYICIRPEGKGYLLASLHREWMETHDGATEANARLIAAAPDLLGAAKNAVDCWGVGRLNITSMCEFMDALRDAVAKAEGK